MKQHYYGTAPRQIPNDTSPYGNRTFFMEKKELLICPECGNKWIPNNIKSTYSCPFCNLSLFGNTTIEEIPMPDYYIPFMISQGKAADLVREALKHNPFLPKKIRNFSDDMLKGFFLPYWLYDIGFSTSMIIKWQRGYSRYRIIRYFNADAHTYFERFTVEASEAFPQRYSQRIEPYQLQDIQPYDASFESCYCSAYFNTPAIKAKEIAVDRLEEICCKKGKSELIKRPKHKNPTSITIEDTTRNFTIPYEEYALMPVWYFSTIYRKQKYTFIVNGQTGKVEVDLPPNRILYTAISLVFFLFFSYLIVPAFYDQLQKPFPDELKAMGYTHEIFDSIGPFPIELLHQTITCGIIWFAVLFLTLFRFIKRKLKESSPKYKYMHNKEI